MWRTGVSTGKTCFFVKTGLFSALSHYANKERASRAFDAESQISSTCLGASKEMLSTEISGIYSINKGSDWQWLENRQPLNVGKMCTVSRF